MSVLGFDFGNDGCYVAVARSGGIETLANEYSDRRTPSCVSFGEKQRFMGTAAMQQITTNVKNCVVGFKHLIGRDMNDPDVQPNLRYIPANVQATQNGGIGVQVRYLNEAATFTPEQITGMLFTKLKNIAEANLGNKVNDCVVSVPCFFTDVERRALLDAVQVAGLNCLKLMNETTATALAYGLFKQDLPDVEAKPRNVIFVDMGHSSLQTCACSFNKGKLKVLSTAYDKALGGRDLTMKIVQVMAEDFKKRYKIDPLSAQKPFQRLTKEADTLKKRMSANKQVIPVNIESFMEDKDVSFKMNRETFEGLIDPELARVKVVFENLLKSSGLKKDEIYAVEIVGGSSRVPAVKKLVQDVFGQEPATTLNADESVSRGCAIQCAILSPTFRVRDFSVMDCQPYPIKLGWEKSDPNEDNEFEVFGQFHQIPFSKMLTFYRSSPFALQASYSNPTAVTHPRKILGEFQVTNVTPEASGGSSKVKVKVRVNTHGIFKVSSASMITKVEDEAMEVEEQKEATVNGKEEAAEKPEDLSADKQNVEKMEEAEQKPEEQAAPEAQAATAPAEPVKTKKKVKSIDLPVTEAVPQLTPQDLHRLVERENEMVMADKLEKERADAKNAVEEYVYDMRDKLCSELEEYVDDKDRDLFRSFLQETEDWLYEDGEDCKKQDYLDRLKKLKDHGNPIVARFREAAARPVALDKFRKALVHIRKALDLYAAQDETYAHIKAEEMKKVEKCLSEKAAWHDKKMQELGQLKPSQNSPVLASQIDSECKILESTCNPILNTPKPKVEPPPAPEPAKEDEQKAEPMAEENTAAPADGASQAPSAEMELD